ncbi:hypothetical protein B0T18DRAFT_193248 [Schizothecium vesticola]|uniref:Uncharacterized protein n=1 Tax=Schizothecium vesticola TaxID=314040 RepID=A0AA40ER09_9PEZI|nr:hypothetical protein B0T18DRAFT_193248 [Schizothecium vesticola]
MGARNPVAPWPPGRCDRRAWRVPSSSSTACGCCAHTDDQLSPTAITPLPSPQPRRLPVSVPAACHGAGFRHATPQCRSHRRPQHTHTHRCVTEVAEIWSVSDVCTSTAEHHTGDSTPRPPSPAPSLSTRGGGCQWLGEQSYQTLAKLPWNLSRRKPLARPNVSFRGHRSGSRSPSPSKCETKRRGEPFSLASNGTGVALAVPRNLASPSQHVVCCRSFLRVSTTCLASPGHGGCPLLQDREDAARGEGQAQVSTAPQMVASAATDRATVRCIRRTGYHNGDTTLARHRVPSFLVDRLAEADCPHGRRLAFPLNESPWAVPGARGGGVPASRTTI